MFEDTCLKDTGKEDLQLLDSKRTHTTRGRLQAGMGLSTWFVNVK